MRQVLSLSAHPNDAFLFILDARITDSTLMNQNAAVRAFRPVTDYGDGVTEETAIRSCADAVVTRNEQDYANAGIRVMTPDEPAQMLKSQKHIGETP